MNASQILADIELSVSRYPNQAERLSRQVGMLTATVKTLCAEQAIAAAEPVTPSAITASLEQLQGAADRLSGDPRGYGWDAVTDAIGKAIEKVYECGSIHHEEDPRDVATARLWELQR